MLSLKNYKSVAVVFFTLVIACLTLCVFAFANFRGTGYANAEQSGRRTRIVGYLPTWSYQEYRNIDFSALTHINISFCNVNGNEITCGIPDGEMKAIVDKAHNNNAKVFAALGGGGYGDPYRSLISSPEKIASLNEKIVAFCEKHNLDGIDLDIELDSSDSIWNDYGAWVSALRSICDGREWELSTATAQWVAGRVSEQTFGLFDFVNVMAYDNYENIRPSGGSQNSHSSYGFSVECLNYFHTQKNIPKEKLVLGVPFYGRGYNDDGTTDWDLYVAFFDIIDKNAENYDSDYADYYDGAVYPVAYTGASTMRDKCELAKEYGGIMIWEITLDADGEYSLLSLIKAELIPSASPPVEQPETTPESNRDAEPEENNVGLWVGVGVGCATAVGAGIALTAVLIIKKKK